MLLGDGCIDKNLNDSCWFSLHHSMKQIEYLKWKIKQIDNFFEKKRVTRKFSLKENLPQYNKKTEKTYYSCRYRLYWPKYFKILRKRIYRADKTKRAEYLLRHMETDKQLFIWFMDDGSEESHLNKHKDGSLYRTNPRLMLHICDYTLDDSKLIVDWFKEKYKVEPRIVFTTTKKPRLRFVSKDARILFNRISVYVKQLEYAKSKFSLCLERYC